MMLALIALNEGSFISNSSSTHKLERKLRYRHWQAELVTTNTRNGCKVSGFQFWAQPGHLFTLLPCFSAAALRPCSWYPHHGLGCEQSVLQEHHESCPYANLRCQTDQDTDNHRRKAWGQGNVSWCPDWFYCLDKRPLCTVSSLLLHA